jgi:hypothetical protein
MPYKIRYSRKKKCYSVINKKTKRVFSKCTTKDKANKQSRLLRAIMFNKDFVPNNNRLGGRTRRLGTHSSLGTRRTR